MIGRIVIPGDLAVDQELGQPVPAVFLGRRRGAQQRDHVIGIDARSLVQILRPLTSQPPSVLVARVEAANTSEPELGSLRPMQKHNSPRGDARQDLLLDLLLAVAQDHRAALPVGGRVARGSARGAPASPRSRHSVRDASARGRRISSARSCRSSLRSPTLRLKLRARTAPAAVRREGAGLDLLAQKGADLLAQFLGLGRQLDRIETKAESSSVPHDPAVMNGHSSSAPRSATIRPSRAAQSASLPNSSRHDHSRRVAWCSECS